MLRFILRVKIEKNQGSLVTLKKNRIIIVWIPDIRLFGCDGFPGPISGQFDIRSIPIVYLYHANLLTRSFKANVVLSIAAVQIE